MDEERTRSITMGSSHLEERQKGAVCTESSARLEALCQYDGWLEAFIRDTEEHQLLHAPARLREDTLAKVQRLRFSKRIQLISYSLKVCTAAAAALFILFTTPVFLQPAGYPGILAEAPRAGASGGPKGQKAAPADGSTHSQTEGRAGRTAGPQTDSGNGRPTDRPMSGGTDNAAGRPIGDGISDGMAWTRQTLQEGFQQITGSIDDLSNALFPGR